MLLSVIVPIYNVEKYISRCLDCLVHQNLTEEEYEILVIDDGSLDKSFEIVEEYSSDFSNIFLFRQENGGPCNARNFLLKIARGEYIYFMDADDLFTYNTLGLLVKEAKRKSLDIISFNTLVTSDITSFESSKPLVFPNTSSVFNGYQYIEQYPSLRFEIWWYLVKTSLLRSNHINFGENQFNGDVLFTVNTFIKAKRIVHVPVTLHCYYQGKISIMRSKDLAHRRVVIESLHAMIQNFSQFIAHLETKKVPNIAAVIQNLEARRNTFVLFFLSKLVRSDLHADQAKWYIEKLKKIEAYPLKSLNPNPTSLLKKLVVNVLNREYFLLPAIELTTLQYNLRSSA